MITKTSEFLIAQKGGSKLDSTKGKFMVFFWGVLFFLFYFKVFAFVWNQWVYGSFILDLLGNIFIIFIVTPVAFLTARFLVMKIPVTYHMFGIIVIVLLFSWNVYDDHREKSLVDLISYQPSSFTMMTAFGISDWRTEELEAVEELKGFLSKYRVKKIRDSEWDSNVSGEEGFSFMIHMEGKSTGASIYESRILSYNKSSYYKVLNGPIDMEWIESFKEKYGNES